MHIIETKIAATLVPVRTDISFQHLYLRFARVAKHRFAVVTLVVIQYGEIRIVVTAVGHQL